MLKKQYLVFCEYNRRMNKKLYSVSAQLTDEELNKDRGAFFKSILGTLEHIMIADLAWLRRFQSLPNMETTLSSLAEYPAITTLNQKLYPNFSELQRARERLDSLFKNFIEALDESQFDKTFQYKNMLGKSFEGELWTYITHVFNHQTHHRGQATTLLTQIGHDVGITDLPFVVLIEPD
jgi:uncharacterized damage-inducible protein DinB